MRSTRITASFVVCLGVALAANPALALYRHWNGKGKAGVFDDPTNWGISQADAFSKASCKPGCESQIGDNPSGTYTLSADAWANRFVLDKANQNLVFEFGEHTATFIGLDNVAFGATAAGSGVSLFVKSGTICIPTSFIIDGAEKISANYSFLGLPRENAKFTDATIMADGDLSSGTFGTIDVRETRLLFGTNNCIGARNGGVFKTKSLSFNAENANSASNHLTFANGGVWQNVNATPSHLDIPFQGTAKGHRVEFLDGGTLSGFDGLYVNNGSLFRVIFSGADTAIDIEAGSDVSRLNGVSNRLEVVNGAKVRFLDSNGTSKARFWLGTFAGSDGNVIRIDGEGSLLELAASGTLVGQYSGQGNGIEVANKGELIVNNLQVGRGKWSEDEKANPETYTWADHNYVTVSSGGRITDVGTTYVGYGDAPLRDSRLTVISNGIVSNQQMIVGNSMYALSNVVLVADGGMLLTKGDATVANGKNASFGNRVTVGTNGTFVAGNLYIGTKSSSETLEGATKGNVLEVLSNGIVRVGVFADYGRDTLLRIDDGKFYATGGVVLPHYNSGNTNLTVEISGAAPILRTDSDSDYTVSRAAYAMAFRKWAHIKFKVPKTGWSEPPIQVPNGELGIFGNSILEFDLDEFLAENGGVGGNVVLTNARLADYQASMISDSNALLKKKYGVRANGTARCRVVQEGQKLILKTPSGKGLVLVVR